LPEALRRTGRGDREGLARVRDQARRWLAKDEEGFQRFVWSRVIDSPTWDTRLAFLLTDLELNAARAPGPFLRALLDKQLDPAVLAAAHTGRKSTDTELSAAYSESLGVLKVGALEKLRRLDPDRRATVTGDPAVFPKLEDVAAHSPDLAQVRASMQALRSLDPDGAAPRLRRLAGQRPASDRFAYQDLL
jgi:hypothetical protein